MSLPSEAREALITLFRGGANRRRGLRACAGEVRGSARGADLKEIAAGHREAVAHLERELKQQGIVAPHGPGAWGNMFNALGSLTALVNDEVPLQMLQLGEEGGIAVHERALAAEGFSPAVVRRIHEGIDRCKQNSERLQRLRDVITTRPTRPMI